MSYLPLSLCSFAFCHSHKYRFYLCNKTECRSRILIARGRKHVSKFIIRFMFYDWADNVRLNFYRTLRSFTRILLLLGSKEMVVFTYLNKKRRILYNETCLKNVYYR